MNSDEMLAVASRNLRVLINNISPQTSHSPLIITTPSDDRWAVSAYTFANTEDPSHQLLERINVYLAKPVNFYDIKKFHPESNPLTLESINPAYLPKETFAAAQLGLSLGTWVGKEFFPYITSIASLVNVNSRLIGETFFNIFPHSLLDIISKTPLPKKPFPYKLLYRNSPPGEEWRFWNWRLCYYCLIKELLPKDFPEDIYQAFAIADIPNKENLESLQKTMHSHQQQSLKHLISNSHHERANTHPT